MKMFEKWSKAKTVLFALRADNFAREKLDAL